jgi:hypothetical protein
VRTLGWEGVQNDTDRNDAVRDYSFQVGSMLAAEFGVVAFGASGLTHAGSGGVPPLGESRASRGISCGRMRRATLPHTRPTSSYTTRARMMARATSPT